VSASTPSAAVVVVMGVAGVGKTAVGKRLAGRLGWPFFDADGFHSPANVEKMRQGIGLTDEDRWPWLDALSAEMLRLLGEGRSAVFACSALKQAYRDRLQVDPRVRFLYLKARRSVLEQRLAHRPGHYAGPSLLESQLETLEEPDERVPAVDANRPLPEVVAAAEKALGLGRAGGGPAGDH
jgi:gluconokinase